VDTVTVVDWGELTWPNAGKLSDAAVGLIPTGSIEQHGPHLPVAFDSIAANALALEVAERIVEPVVVPPFMTAGLSDHHLAFPGTVSFSRETFGGILTAYVEGLERMGVRRIAVISAHGGNFGFIGEFARAYSAAHPETKIVGYDQFRPFVDTMIAAGASAGLVSPPADSHAGALETSLALHLIGADRVGEFENVWGYTAAEPGWHERILDEGLHAVTETGVLGLPAGANAEAGRAILDALAGLLAGWMASELGVSLR
jgi:creatinine amidohydrolase